LWTFHLICFNCLIPKRVTLVNRIDQCLLIHLRIFVWK
jgi:hypothetical protein